MSWVDDAIDDMYERREREALTTTPSADDTEQIDDQVQDLLTTMLCKLADEWFNEELDPDGLVVREFMEKFRKDLASLGIRLTYDTTIGGG